MPGPLSPVVDRVRRLVGRKAMRYSLVSVVSVGVSQVTLFVLLVLFHWKATSANIVAVVIGGIPSYYLNRRWAWGKTGKSHLWREIAPFWFLAFLGLASSTLAVDAAESWATGLHRSRLVQAIIINGASITTFGVLWIGKFFLFNKVLFVKDEDLRSTLAEEVVA